MTSPSLRDSLAVSKSSSADTTGTRAPSQSCIRVFSSRDEEDFFLHRCYLTHSLTPILRQSRGGAIVYRAAQYHSTLVTHLFSICTPYFPPSPVYEPLHLLVNKHLPNFRYQEHFASGELEERLQSRTEIKSFLNGMYGARGPNGEVAFEATKGVFLENLPKLGLTKLLTEAELEYYVQEYARHGLHGPLNWYRNREVNYVEELEHFFQGGKVTEGPRVQQEVLFVLATKDQALKPAMAAKMEERIARLTRKEVKAGHWALWEKPEEVNGILREWFERVVFGGKSKL